MIVARDRCRSGRSRRHRCRRPGRVPPPGGRCRLRSPPVHPGRADVMRSPSGDPCARHRSDADRAARGGPDRTRSDHPGPVPAVADPSRPDDHDPTRAGPGHDRGGRRVRDPATTAAGHDRPPSRIGVAVQSRHHHQHRWSARPGPHHPPHQAPAHPAKPAWAISARSPGPSIGPRPSVGGKPDNPTSAPTCGDHPTDSSRSPPTKAPSCSATATGPTRSGPPRRRLVPKTDLRAVPDGHKRRQSAVAPDCAGGR